MNKLEDYNRIAHERSLNKFKQASLLYLTGKYSLTTLSKQFKFGRTHFSKYLKTNNIEVINKQNAVKFNQHIFDIIDTEEKAYWLGFLFADGYISSRDNLMELSLMLSDKEHLEKFKKFLEWSGNVKTDHYRCRLYITNKHLKETLIKHGFFPRKSLTLKFPNNTIPNHLLVHFIRGYVDGDGCIYVNSETKHARVSIIGTKDFITNMVLKMNWKFNKLVHDKRHHENTVSMNYGGRVALPILHELYENAIVYLNRKYFKYKDFAVLYSNV